MLDRRSFVTSLAASGALAATRRLPRPLVDGTLPIGRPGSTIPATNIPIQASYPPIPELGKDVFERRLDRARELTARAGAQVLFATSGATNFDYLVGADFWRSERLIALLLPVNGAPVIVAPSFEVERVKRGARIGTVRGWEESEDPFALVRTVLAESGAKTTGAGTTVLVEPKTDYWTAAALQRAMPDARLVDGSATFEQLRVIKTPEELARMRRAVEITEDAIATVFDRLEAGMRDTDISRMMAEEHAKRGVATDDALVQLGGQSALPHGAPYGATLAPEMVVLIDAGCKLQGYTSDITRTRWFGSNPPKKFVEVYNTVHDAQTAAMEKTRPGVPCEEIDRAARAVITKAGYGKYFTHRLGHGIGLDGHEAAYMVEGNTRPLEPGFVFSVEPGIYMLGEWGVRLEDDYTCTADGGAPLSRRAPRV